MNTNAAFATEELVEPPSDNEILAIMKDAQNKQKIVDGIEEEILAITTNSLETMRRYFAAVVEFNAAKKLMKESQGFGSSGDEVFMRAATAMRVSKVLESIKNEHYKVASDLLETLTDIDKKEGEHLKTDEEATESENDDDLSPDAEEPVEATDDEKPGDALDDVEAGDITPNFRLVMGLDAETGRSVLQDEQGNEVTLHRHMKPNIDQRIPAELVVSAGPKTIVMVQLRSGAMRNYLAKEISWSFSGGLDDALGWRIYDEYKKLIQEDEANTPEGTAESSSDQSDAPVKEAPSKKREEQQTRAPKTMVSSVEGETPPEHSVEGDHFLNFHKQAYVYENGFWRRKPDLDDRLTKHAIESGELPTEKTKPDAPAVNSHDTETVSAD